MADTKTKAERVKAELPILGFASAGEWERWLAERPRDAGGAWLKLGKKNSGVASVSRQEAIDGALCHGWIDGQLKPFDERYWLVRFTPRGKKSIWSEVNRTRAEQLIAEGRMCAGGLAEVERAKSGGRWKAAYAPQSKAVVPDDFRAALDRKAAAKALFERLDSANRYSFLHRLLTTSKPAIRAAKIEKFVEMLARGETFHPLKEKQQRGKA